MTRKVSSFLSCLHFPHKGVNLLFKTHNWDPHKATEIGQPTEKIVINYPSPTKSQLDSMALKGSISSTLTTISLHEQPFAAFLGKSNKLMDALPRLMALSNNIMPTIMVWKQSQLAQKEYHQGL